MTMPGFSRKTRKRSEVGAAFALSPLTAHILADSAEGIRIPRSEKASREVSQALREMFPAKAAR